MTAHSYTLARPAAEVCTSIDEDPPLFQWPGDIILAGDSLLITDVFDGRIVVLDTDLNLLGRFGRRGAGPGELRSPDAVQIWDGQIVVAESGNQRMSFFDRDGAFQETRKLPWRARSFVMGSTGEAFISAVSNQGVLAAVNAEGQAREMTMVGSAPDTMSGRELAELGWGTRRVASFSADTVFVLDEANGRFLVLDMLAETVISSSHIPGEVIAGIQQKEAVISAGFGTRVAYVGLFKHFSAGTADRRLLVLFSYDDIVGAVIDPDSMKMTLIRTEGDNWFSSSGAGALAGSTLWLVSSNCIGSVQLD